MDWLHELRERFRNRPELSMAELTKEFDVESSPDVSELVRCLTIFAEEYGVTAGRLRRSDSLLVFLEPTSRPNPIKAAFDDFGRQDRISELNYELKRRRTQLGTRPRRSPTTVGDYVDAWLGRGDFG